MNERTTLQAPGEDRAEVTPSTDREVERDREDRAFVPVIVKRTDEARRHPDDILNTAIEEGFEQLHRPALSLLLSAIAAGLILGFVAMSVGVVSTALSGVESEILKRIAVAMVYPLGFVVCIMSGTELFTEHTATAVYPVLDQRSGLSRPLRLWLIVGVGNLIGTLVSASLLTVADSVVGAREGYIQIGHHLTDVELIPLGASAILAGWLMALGAWLILATPPRSSQIASIYIVTFIIGLGGLHHSIAGSAEMLTAYLISDHFSAWQACRFIGLALIGNLAGGSFFVAGLNYAHIRQSRPAGASDEEATE